MSKYNIREKISEDNIVELKEYSELMRELLFYRGIKTAKDAREFLNPNYESNMHDPFLLKSMDKAVKRILFAIKKKEKIIIYSDYDCDGIPGAVVLYDFFKKIGYKNFSNYIPHRHEDGYGFHISAIEKFIKDGVNLIITVDCGIADYKSVDFADKFGIDVIITDHHIANGEMPKAYAIINPKQKDDKYPDKNISGAGVAFKLAQALFKKGDFNIKDGWEKWLLDMVGLATIADMVPLLGENRLFAYYGLKVLRKSPRVGFMKLCSKIKVNQKEITEDDIGFMIAPRINVASRMGMPYDAFRLLVTDDEIKADELSTYLNTINDERKGIVASIVKEIKKKIEKLNKLNNVIVMGNPNWKPSLLGLVANSVSEEYKRTIFLWGRDNKNILKGSCRSDGSVNLVDMMEAVKENFINFGGHSRAGGFSINTQNIHTLEEVLNVVYEGMQKNYNNDKDNLFIDKKLFIDDINWDTYKIVEQLAPFGIGNLKPLFMFERVEIEEINHFGKEKNHLKLGFKKSNGKIIYAIAFFKTDNSFKKDLNKGEKINLIATIEKSTFRNFPELRLRIMDII